MKTNKSLVVLLGLAMLAPITLAGEAPDFDECMQPQQRDAFKIDFDGLDPTLTRCAAELVGSVDPEDPEVPGIPGPDIPVVESIAETIQEATPDTLELVGADTAVVCWGVGEVGTCNTAAANGGRCWGMGSWVVSVEIVSGRGSYTLEAICDGDIVAGCTAYSTPGGTPQCKDTGDSTSGGFECRGTAQAQTTMEINRGCGDPINPGKFCLAVAYGIPYDEDEFCNRLDTVALLSAVEEEIE